MKIIKLVCIFLSVIIIGYFCFLNFFIVKEFDFLILMKNICIMLIGSWLSVVIWNLIFNFKETIEIFKILFQHDCYDYPKIHIWNKVGYTKEGSIIPIATFKCSKCGKIWEE